MPTTITQDVAVRFRRMLQFAFEQVLMRYSDKVHESFYLFGNLPARMRVVGHEMASYITRPFAHLEVEGSNVGTPQLTIDLWDESETNIRCQVGSLNGDAKFKKTTAVSSDGRLVGQQLRNVLTFYDHSAQHIISAVGWGRQLSVYERWKPLARPLLEWHNDRNIRMIHASLVAQDGQGVLFGGKSGSGKSTAALACLFAGFHFLSEDYVGLGELQDGSFVGHSLYNSVFLKVSDATRFPSLAPFVTKGSRHEEKCAVVLSRVFPERLTRTAVIRVLVLPRIVDSAKPKFYAATKGEALLALGPSSLLQIPSRRLGVRGFHQLAELVDRVPCYWLELGRDRESIPQCVEEILGKAT